MKTLKDLEKLPSAIVVVFERNNDGQISITREPLTQVEDEWPYPLDYIEDENIDVLQTNNDLIEADIATIISQTPEFVKGMFLNFERAVRQQFDNELCHQIRQCKGGCVCKYVHLKRVHRITKILAVIKIEYIDDVPFNHEILWKREDTEIFN
jgi:hypothetical protein